MYVDDDIDGDPRIDPQLEFEAIAESLAAPPQRRYFDLGGRGEIYMRRSRRRFEIDETQGLDIARVEVKDEFQRQGVFSNALSIVEEASQRMGLGYVYVEAIYNPVLTLALARRGYTVGWNKNVPFDMDTYARWSNPPAVAAYKLFK